MRSSSRLVPLVLVAAALVGCGRSAAPLARPAAPVRQQPGKAPTVKAVAPDDTKVLAEDTRRAKYWAGDAVRVMAIHATAMSTPAISAAANVYVSPARFHEGKPCVFTARHYGFDFAAQYSELPDYNRLAFNLKPLPDEVAVNAKLALDLARGAQAARPGGTTEAGRFFLSSRAILVNAAKPEWRLYASQTKFAIDATTKEVLPPEPQINPADPLNQGPEVEYQRAAAVFLPLSTGQPNNRSAPVGSN